MRQAVIVSTARTPLTKSHRGELNITPGPTLASFAVRAAVERSGIDPALIEDAVRLGQRGAGGGNDDGLAHGDLLGLDVGLVFLLPPLGEGRDGGMRCARSPASRVPLTRPLPSGKRRNASTG